MTTRRLALSFIASALATALVACGHEATGPRDPSAKTNAESPAAAGGSPTTDKAPEMAPTPYSTDELRASNKPGTIYRYKIETAGEPATIKVMEFTSGSSAEKAEVKDLVLDEAGKAKGPATVEKASWDELRKHGEFPRAGLTVERGSIDTPAGKFDAMIYIVKSPNGDTSRFYFAKSYAGPPVLFYKERGGVRLMTSTLLERKPGG